MTAIYDYCLPFRLESTLIFRKSNRIKLGMIQGSLHYRIQKMLWTLKLMLIRNGKSWPCWCWWGLWSDIRDFDTKCFLFSKHLVLAKYTPSTSYLTFGSFSRRMTNLKHSSETEERTKETVRWMSRVVTRRKLLMSLITTGTVDRSWICRSGIFGQRSETGTWFYLSLSPWELPWRRWPK